MDQTRKFFFIIMKKIQQKISFTNKIQAKNQSLNKPKQKKVKIIMLLMEKKRKIK